MPLKVSFEFPSSQVSFFIGGGQNADPQSMDYPHGLPQQTTPRTTHMDYPNH